MKTRLCVLVFIALGFFLHAPVQAANSGSGSAYGLSADLSLLPLLGSVSTANVPPTPSVSGSAPPDFNKSQTVANVNVPVLGLVTIGTGLITVSTQSTLAANSVTSNAQVDNLGINLTLVGLTADVVTSRATASCSGSNVSYSGSTEITNPKGTVGALLGAIIPTNPPPNTHLLALLGLDTLTTLTGIDIILNEQVLAANTFTVNGIHIHLSDAGLFGLLGGVVNGDVYVAQSKVSMDACTAPSAVPNLAIHKTGPASAIVGTPFDYGITLDNIGTAATTGTITVTDTVPAGLTINSVSPGTGFGCSTAGQAVTCTRTTPITAGAANVPVATIHVTPTTAAAISNSASVSGGGDSSPNNNTTPPVSTQVNDAATPDLAITKTGPASALVGSPFDYVIKLANVDGAPTSGTITVTDVLPPGLTINSVTAGANFWCTNTISPIVCASSVPIAAGASGITAVTINVTPTVAGPLSNTASVSGGGDNSPSNNTTPPVNTTVGILGNTVTGVPALSPEALLMLALAMAGLTAYTARRRGRL